MKFALIVLGPLILGACSPEKSPVDPTSDPVMSTANPVPTTAGWLWAMAVRTDGGCIPGATFTVVSGPSYVGEVITQQTPCSVWDYGDVGIMLKRLTPGVAITLRASADGYRAVARTVFARSAGTVESFVLETLE